jgi:branched-chain amino acid transport system permease protein
MRALLATPAGRVLSWAGLALVLAFPVLGLETVGQGAVLGIDLRLDRVAMAVGIVALGAVLVEVWRSGLVRMPAGLVERASAIPARWLGLAALAAALLLPVTGNQRWIDLGARILTYVMLGWGLNIVVGLAGLLDLGYVAFYGIGAYTLALLTTHFGLGFWLCLPIAGLAAAVFGIILGFPVLRLRGDYLAIVTLGFGEIIRIVLLNWASLTNGPNGIGNIPRPSFFGLAFVRHGGAGRPSFAEFFGLDFSPLPRQIFLYLIILAMALGTNWLTLRLRRLPIGRSWEALREDEVASRALGIDPTRVKLSAFALGAGFAGLAGAFFAAQQNFISPESFTFTESAMILAIVVLGGMGGQLGIVLAAIVLVATPELLRVFELYRMLIFGAGMVLIMVVRPRGLFAHRRPSILLGASASAVEAG